jgi:ABC-type multidrug transport system fused ATPase/permease subunit
MISLVNKIKEIKKIINAKNYFLLLLLGFFLIILSSLEFIGIGAIPIYIGLIIDTKSFVEKFNLEFLTNYSKSELVLYSSIILLCIFVFKNILQSLIIYFQGKLIKKIKVELSSKLFRKYLDLEFRHFLEKNSSVFIRTVNLDVGNTSIFMLNIINLVKETLLLIAICSLLLVAEPLISVSLFLYFFLSVYIFYYFTQKNLFSRGKKIQKINSDIIRLINETLGSIKEIKIFKQEEKQSNSFISNISNSEEYAFKNYFVKSIPRIYLEILCVFAVVSLIIFFSLSEDNIIEFLPFLSLIVLSAIRLMPSLNAIQNALSTLKTIISSYNHIKEEIYYLDNKINLGNEKKKEINFNHHFELKKINFSYQKNNNFVLRDINLKIFNGDKIGIVGSSGSGKTTLVNIILGLVKPNHGEIIIDDKKINFDEFTWSLNIGYVPQETFLIDDTIKNNILFGLKEDNFTTKHLEDVLKKSQIYDFVMSQNLKFNTQVGERGVNLSIGQKQRIGIARALYRNPKLIVFDESTSSLDSETEKNFVDDVFGQNEDKTIIFISHKKDALIKCNKIYDLNKRTLVKE